MRGMCGRSDQCRLLLHAVPPFIHLCRFPFPPSHPPQTHLEHKPPHKSTAAPCHPEHPAHSSRTAICHQAQLCTGSIAAPASHQPPSPNPQPRTPGSAAPRLSPTCAALLCFSQVPHKHLELRLARVGQQHTLRAVHTDHHATLPRMRPVEHTHMVSGLRDTIAASQRQQRT